MPYLDSEIKVLVVDDDEDDFFITSDLLRQINDLKITVDWCYNYNKAIEHLQQRTHHIYFVDYRLGAKTGIDFLKDAIALHCEEPIVLLTGKGSRLIDIEAMRIGATDYLTKGEITPDKLERCIRYALARSGSTKELRANERKYRSIFERSQDAVFVADAGLNFRDINYAATTMLGYEEEELKGMCLYDLVCAPFTKKQLEMKLEEKGSFDDIETELFTKTGEKIVVVLSASKEQGTHNAEYVQGIIRDITNLKKAEKANLQSEKLAAMGRLVRTLAHEVRNPLNNINMSVEEMQQISGNEELALYLDIIHRNSTRIGGLITELLDSSRPSELNFEKWSLQGIMDDTISDAIDRITLKRINMKISYADKAAFIMADKDKLKIAFLNLLINAVEAIQHNAGKLSVAITSNGDQHSVVVSDNGMGIPEDYLPLLFEPYFTSKRNGMGLGLATTLNILQSHKAAIDVRSVVQEGTTFFITFPAAAN
ncbi:MAG: PAS domain S-box protein [Chitinophagaceae bacterium]